MGNVNAREGENPSGGAEESHLQQGRGGQHGSYVGHRVHELMGHSPPHSPGATHSPFLFSPQVPMIPLQRPDEPHVPSSSWMHGVDEYEDMSCEQGIPTMITWSHGGKHVAVEGSWDNWKTKKPLQRSGQEFTITKVLPSGVYQYRFLVDGEWKHASEFPWIHDDLGNPYNILDLQEYVPEEVESIAGFEPPQSPDSSYNSLHLTSEDYSKEPPLAPPHLNLTLLNSPSFIDSTSHLSRPPHVVLNHLYVQKGRSSQPVLALGTTHRFLAKYVTVVLYKSLQK